MTSESLPFNVLLVLVAGAAGYGAYHLGDLTLGTGAGVVAAYALHLLSLRSARGRCRRARILDRLTTELEGTVHSETVVVRRFSLATTALIEGAMEVEEIVRTLISAASRPGEGFGERALDAGYLSAGEVRELTETRREARFLTDQVRVARQKIRRYRDEAGDRSG